MGFVVLMVLSVSPENWGEEWENWVSQGFLADECEELYFPRKRGVRFPKHIRVEGSVNIS